jgi:hypothetical protein
LVEPRSARAVGFLRVISDLWIAVATSHESTRKL